MRPTSHVKTIAASMAAVGLLWTSTSALLLADDAPLAEAPLAQRLVADSGVQGGLVVHLGCGNGHFTAALAARPFLVQALDTDAENVRTAREHLRATGSHGQATVDRFDGIHLPYIDNLVNLLIAQNKYRVSKDEIVRVLAPGGVAFVDEGSRWTKIVKRYPDQLDDWTHFLHGPDGNAVSDDQAVDFPFHFQWIGRPDHSRDHELTTSMDVMVAAGGRIFYILDEGPTALSHWLPSCWNLVARDAFNGLVLWKRPLSEWRPYQVGGRTSLAADLWRRLVASDSRVYATESIFGPVVALDAASGEVLHTYAGTEQTEEIILHGDVLYLVVNCLQRDQIDRRQLAQRRGDPEPKQVLAIRADDGTTLWSKKDDQTVGVQPLTMATGSGRVYFQNTEAVVCLAADTGEELWRYARRSVYARPGRETPTLVVAGDVVLSADRAEQPAKPRRNEPSGKKPAANYELIALSAADGKELWRCDCTTNVGAGADVFVADGLVWVGEAPRRNASDYLRGRNLHTGEVERSFPPADNWPTWHHHRCYRDKATQRFILAGRTGIEFLDLKTGQLATHHWTRGICEYGIMPAYGLIYSPPDQCACYPQSKLHGFYALAPRRSEDRLPAPLPADQRLSKGPAFGQLAAGQAGSPATDWPTMRCDNARSGFVPVRLPTRWKPLWHTKLGAELSTLTAAGGRIFAASPETSEVYCLDAADGHVVWRYATAAPVDSPPTVALGYAVFGCGDGCIYALRATDGQLAWRFQAAPRDLRLVDCGRLKSVWPVHGSVLVEGQAVYAAAGRTSHLDGGMWLYKLDLPTGRVLIEKHYYARDPESGESRLLFPPFPAELLPDRELPGLLPDVFSADERNLYLRSVPLSRQLEIREEEYCSHLFGSLGFLEDTWWERSYWIFGWHFYGGARGHAYARTLFPGGRILTFDSEHVYGYVDRALDKDNPGLFSADKSPSYTDLVERLKNDGWLDRMERQARREGQPIDREALANFVRSTYVWNNGMPRDPEAMELTRTAVGEVIRQLQKYDYRWHSDVPLYPQAMVLDEQHLFLAGAAKFDEDAVGQYLASAPVDRRELPPEVRDAVSKFTGKQGGVLMVVGKTDGQPVAAFPLPATPVFDGMIAARDRLVLALVDGSALCLAAE